jgi:hypothetical protein
VLLTGKCLSLCSSVERQIELTLVRLEFIKKPLTRARSDLNELLLASNNVGCVKDLLGTLPRALRRARQFARVENLSSLIKEG